MREEREPLKMIRLPIDESSAIVQPYYDGGDSYPGHSKYSLTKKYKATPENGLFQSWCAFEVTVAAEGETILDYEGADIDISEYNRFRIFGSIPGDIHVKLYCNGELVMDEQGSGSTGYMDTSIRTKQKVIHQLKYIFRNTGKGKLQLTLYYLGVLNDNVKPKNPYTEEWEGCFCEKPQHGLYNEVAASHETIKALREKVKKAPYRKMYQEMKAKADALMLEEPEKMIAKTIRRHHRAPISKLLGAETLAICGQVEQDERMLKMACRYALSLACCENWCADVMETVQTITWHHRSFDESDATSAVCTVISLAGGLLSWHGLNLLYNAIIMKGLPRMESDFMTMDYIYKCNQGIAFMKGYLFGLSTLMQCYPRYKVRYEEARRLLEEMYANSIEADGGCKEGAKYWLYTITRYLNCQYLIAGCEKKTMREVIGDKLTKTAGYGLANLDQNACLLPFNDSANHFDYGIMVPAVLYAVTGKREWAAVCQRSKTHFEFDFDMLVAASVDVPEDNGDFLTEFACFESVGLTVCTRENVQFAIMGGKSNNTHCHSDKGSFLININGEEAVPDCCRGYDNPEHVMLEYAVSHSLAIPVTDEIPGEQYRGEAFEAPVELSECSDGVFHWKCDLFAIWNVQGLRSAFREVISKDKKEFAFIDTFEFETKKAVQFRVNLVKGAPIRIIPQNWKPEKEEIRVLIEDENQTVLQKIWTSKESSKVELITNLAIDL